MGGGGSQIDDDEPGLQYGSDESDLSDLLDEELSSVQSGDVERMEFSDNPEEGGDMSLNTSAASIVSMEQAEEVAHSIVENILADAQFDGGVQAGAVEGMEFSDSLNRSAASIVSREVVHSIVETILAGVHVEEGEEINGDISLSSDGWHEVMDEVVEEDDEDNEDEICDGFRFLKQLDPDFICSPRMIVRGIYTGEVLKLVVKRKTEGNLVHWAIFDTKQKKQLLSVKAQMEYRFELSRKAQGSTDGVKVLGGWNWRGWGYGYLKLFPPRDPRVLHIDVQEAIFYGEEVNEHYHVSGANCKNVDKAEGVLCKEEGCGLRIHGVLFTAFETTDENLEYYQARRKRKEREVQDIYLSLVAFYSGEYKICVHREYRLKKYHEEVAWLRKDESARFNDSVEGVDRLKIEKARLIWETTVPKTRSEGNTLAAQVHFLSVAKLIFNKDVDRFWHAK